MMHSNDLKTAIAELDHEIQRETANVGAKQMALKQNEDAQRQFTDKQLADEKLIAQKTAEIDKLKQEIRYADGQLREKQRAHERLKTEHEKAQRDLVNDHHELDTVQRNLRDAAQKAKRDTPGMH